MWMDGAPVMELKGEKNFVDLHIPQSKIPSINLKEFSTLRETTRNRNPLEDIHICIHMWIPVQNNPSICWYLYPYPYSISVPEIIRPYEDICICIRVFIYVRVSKIFHPYMNICIRIQTLKTYFIYFRTRNLFKIPIRIACSYPSG